VPRPALGLRTRPTAGASSATGAPPPAVLSALLSESLGVGGGALPSVLGRTPVSGRTPVLSSTTPQPANLPPLGLGSSLMSGVSLAGDFFTFYTHL
jgi:hypothetical protein